MLRQKVVRWHHLTYEMRLRMQKAYLYVTDKEYGKAGISLEVALCYLGKISLEELLNLLLREANLLSSSAQRLLVTLYYHPIKGWPKHDSRIVALFRQHAEEGLFRGQLEYGQILLYGIRIGVEEVEGITLLRQSKLVEAYMELVAYYYKVQDMLSNII